MPLTLALWAPLVPLPFEIAIVNTLAPWLMTRLGEEREEEFGSAVASRKTGNDGDLHTSTYTLLIADTAELKYALRWSWRHCRSIIGTLLGLFPASECSYTLPGYRCWTLVLRKWAGVQVPVCLGAVE